MTNTYAGDKKQSEGAGLENISEKIKRKKSSTKWAGNKSENPRFKICIQKKQWVGRIYLPTHCFFYSERRFFIP